MANHKWRQDPDSDFNEQCAKCGVIRAPVTVSRFGSGRVVKSRAFIWQRYRGCKWRRGDVQKCMPTKLADPVGLLPTP